MKRYDPDITHKEGCGHIFNGWEESPEGDWVIWEDVKREVEQCIRQAKREALMEASNIGWWDTDTKMILRGMAEGIK
jgi:hypothetical protein